MKYLFLIFIFVFVGCSDSGEVDPECKRVEFQGDVWTYKCKRNKRGVVQVHRESTTCDRRPYTVENGVCRWVYELQGLGANECVENCEFECDELEMYSEISRICTNQFCDNSDETCIQGCVIAKSERDYLYLECAGN